MIDKEACKTRVFPEIKKEMDLLDWQNAKTQAIQAINQAHINLELNLELMHKANEKINVLTK